MINIFVDTFAFISLFNEDDHYHKKSSEINNYYLEHGVYYVTTNFVLDESITLLRRYLNHSAVVQFYKTVKSSNVFEFIHITEHIENTAWNIFEKYSDKDFSFTDCTSFAVMNDNKINKVFTHDHHFEQMGFEILIK